MKADKKLKAKSKKPVKRRKRSPKIEEPQQEHITPEHVTTPQTQEPEPTTQPVETTQPSQEAEHSAPSPELQKQPEQVQPLPEVIPPQKPYVVRLDEILSNPKTVQSMFFHIANGGDLISFCEMLDVRYSDLAQWITDSPERQKRFSTACTMGQEWIKRRILKELGSIGLVDIRGLLNSTGSLKDPNEWPDDVARAVQSIEVSDIFEGKGNAREYIGQTKKVKLTDKLRALELIGKEIGMFIDRRKIEVQTKLEDLVGGSYGEEPDFDANGKDRNEAKRTQGGAQ